MTLVEALASYRNYHRDHRNVLTHALGIPLIVLSIEVLLARPVWNLAGLPITPAILFSALAGAWYFRLDARLGFVMAFLLAIFVAIGARIAAISDMAWLGGGIGLFAVGWALQFLGHHYEGRKPAFVDDLRSFLVGPLFVVVEGLFALGLMQGLRREVEAQG